MDNDQSVHNIISLLFVKRGIEKEHKKFNKIFLIHINIIFT